MALWKLQKNGVLDQVQGCTPTAPATGDAENGGSLESKSLGPHLKNKSKHEKVVACGGGVS